MRFTLEIALVAASAAAWAGCVSDEQARAAQAREAYETCAAEQGEDSEQCRELREVARREYDRYERAAQRQWGDRERDRTWTP